MDRCTPCPRSTCLHPKPKEDLHGEGHEPCPYSDWRLVGSVFSAVDTRIILHSAHLSCPKLEHVPLMQMLISKANRWRDATLTAPNLSILSTLGPNTLEKLERVDLTSAKLSNTVDAFLSAPLLRKATICLPDISFLLMPWSQLTTLSLTTDSPDRCLEVLQQCTNLVSAEFNTYAWEEDFDTDIQTVATLPNLTALHLSSDSGIVGHFTPFLRCLTLPALTDFGLSASETLLWPAVVATEFQLRSPLITSLQLLLSAIDSDELLSVLRCTPLLKSLELICCYDCVDDNLLDALRYRASDASHLTPRLDSLLLSEIENSFQESYLEDMIRSRWWSDEQLLLFTSPPPVARWVSLTCTIKESMGHPMDLEFVERMEAFRSEGLRLTLR
ncbi:hypothetical protein B0H10DRAFT_876662 [Mycena sp. CBHHK59/15]|nr:hypothetical protein B0H10DRAFT_876662 [Mycena sp. CBHHK59/15]